MQGHSVVIVDDNAAMRQALCRLFKAADGFHICGEASNGAEAVEIVRKFHPDLIVLDLCMPGKNGLEVAKELKSMMPTARVMLYSMNADDVLQQQAQAAGVEAIVSKAEGTKTFIRKARIALSGHAA
jgi:DNA-binding NarL/FixJ family response regulator